MEDGVNLGDGRRRRQRERRLKEDYLNAMTCQRAENRTHDEKVDAPPEFKRREELRQSDGLVVGNGEQRRAQFDSKDDKYAARG